MLVAWVLLALTLPAPRARADDLLLDVFLAPLDPMPAAGSVPAWRPLWRVPAERGAVFPWLPADQLLAVVRWEAGPVEGPPPPPSVLRLDTVPGGTAMHPPVFPAGVPVVLENPGDEPLDVRVQGLPDPVTVPPAGRLELPEAAWRDAGWLRATPVAAEGESWSALLVTPPFASGWARLTGAGRLLIDFGNVADLVGDHPVTLQLELWLTGQPVCPAGSQPGCSLPRTATTQDGRLVLDPVVLDHSELTGPHQER